MQTVHYHDNDSEDTLTYVECTQCSAVQCDKKLKTIFAAKNLVLKKSS